MPARTAWCGSLLGGTLYFPPFLFFNGVCNWYAG